MPKKKKIAGTDKASAMFGHLLTSPEEGVILIGNFDLQTNLDLLDHIKDNFATLAGNEESGLSQEKVFDKKINDLIVAIAKEIAKQLNKKEHIKELETLQKLMMFFAGQNCVAFIKIMYQEGFSFDEKNEAEVLKYRCYDVNCFIGEQRDKQKEIALQLQEDEENKKGYCLNIDLLKQNGFTDKQIESCQSQDTYDEARKEILRIALRKKNEEGRGAKKVQDTGVQDITKAIEKPSPPLHLAIKGQRLKKVEEILAAGADCCELGNDGENALFWAIVSKNLDMVRVVLRSKSAKQSKLINIRFNGIEHFKSCALGFAVLGSNYSLVKLLVEEFKDDIDIENGSMDDTNTTALSLAVMKGEIEIAELLLQNGANPNVIVVRPSPQTRVMYLKHEIEFRQKKPANTEDMSSLKHHLKAAKAELSSEHNERPRYLLKILITESENVNKVDMVKLLVRHGAKLENDDYLSISAEIGHNELFTFFLAHGLRIEQQKLEDAISRFESEVTEFFKDNPDEAKKYKVNTVIIRNNYNSYTNPKDDDIDDIIAHGIRSGKVNGLDKTNVNKLVSVKRVNSDPFMRYPLAIALIHDDVKIIREIVDLGGADINSLLWVIRERSQAFVLLLNEKMIDIDQEYVDTDSEGVETKKTILDLAIEEGRLDLVKLFLQHNATKVSEASLVKAIKIKSDKQISQEQKESYLQMLDLIISVNRFNFEKLSGFLELVMQLREFHLLRALLSNGLNPDIAQKYLQQQQIQADDEMSLVVERFVSPGCHKETKDNAFHFYAFWSHNPDTAHALVQRGHNINATNALGFTPLHVAANSIKNPRAIIRALINKGANIDDESGLGTALCIAAMRGMSKAVKVLVEEGANLNLKDKDGKTALHLAVKFHDSLSVAILLANGADSTILDKEGKRAVDYIKPIIDNLTQQYSQERSQEKRLGISKEIKKIEKVQFMFAMFHSVNKPHPEYNGYYAIHIIAQYGNVEQLCKYLDKGATLDCTDYKGQTPLEIAVLGCNFKVFEAIYERTLFSCDKQEIDRIFSKLYSRRGIDVSLYKGVILDCKDFDGQTFLEIALLGCNLKVVEIILEHELGIYGKQEIDRIFSKLDSRSDEKKPKEDVKENPVAQAGEDSEQKLDEQTKKMLEYTKKREEGRKEKLYKEDLFVKLLEKEIFHVILDSLLKSGVDINGKISLGRHSRFCEEWHLVTFLHLALYFEYPASAVQYLLDNGARIDIQDLFGYDVLSLATRLLQVPEKYDEENKERYEIVKLIQKHSQRQASQAQSQDHPQEQTAEDHPQEQTVEQYHPEQPSEHPQSQDHPQEWTVKSPSTAPRPSENNPLEKVNVVGLESCL